MTFQFGIDRLLSDEALLSKLSSARVGLVAHPASITGDNQHSVDALVENGCNLLKAFGPQHGMRGDKQDNMIESDDYVDQLHQLPVISLYGEHRFPTDEMLEDLDIVLFDLQDIGCRIYTYITTLYYFGQACARLGKELWVLDRPNPAGRPVDGLYLEPGEESFVGCAPMPTRHGLTTGELANWFKTRYEQDLSLRVIPMSGYAPDGEGFGWPVTRPWINPSPNAASPNMARCFPGTVLIEGTELSEGRGTTTPLEVIGAPALPIGEMLDVIGQQAAPWLEGAMLRPCYFATTFHKHSGELSAGIQMHTDFPGYQHHAFKPYRLIAGLFKALRILSPDYPLWRHHEYEYELDRIPIDVINGGASLRLWVDDPSRSFEDFSTALQGAEQRWLEERQPHLIY